MDTAEKLQVMASHFANGQWEHEEGIVIETLDNPGWSLRTSLFGTILQDQDFAEIEKDLSDEDWYMCRVREGYFEGAGGIHNLETMINIFYNWFEKELAAVDKSSQ